MKFILITGNPVDGFVYHGAFDRQDDAIEYGEDYLQHEADWWIAPLTLEWPKPEFS